MSLLFKRIGYRLPLFLMVLILNGCTISGEYVMKSSDSTLNEKIHIYSNGTFKMFSWFDLGGEVITEGTWSKRNNKIYFIEEKKENSIPRFNYNYFYKPESEYVSISLFDISDTSALFFDRVYLNGSSFPMDTIKAGIHQEKADSIRSIRIKGIGRNFLLQPPQEKANQLILYENFLNSEISMDICNTWKKSCWRLIPLEKGCTKYRKLH